MLGRSFTRVISAALVCAAGASAQQPASRKVDSLKLDLARIMLRTAADDVKKHYYDPAYHGVDLTARLAQYEARLNEVTSLNDGLRVIAAYLDGLKDSHTFFVPPPRPYSFEPGYRMEILGDDCFVTRVRPGTDAAEKLRPGDRIVKFNGFAITRADFQAIGYAFNVLNPASIYQLDVVAPDGTARHVEVKATVRQGKRVLDLTGLNGDGDYYDLLRQEEHGAHLSRSIVAVQGDVAYWKMPEFNLSPEQVDIEFGHARKAGALVLDLRGNPGGAIESLKAVVGNLFDHEVKIADRVTRKDVKPMIAKPRGHVYAGKVIVLVDGASASCAELFARVMQLEKRGAVIGDTTAGAVMESIFYSETSGGDTITPYGFSVTEADLKMTDGKSLEKTGVEPELITLPSAKQIALGVDPVLSHASLMAGGNLTPEQAAKLFPFEWSPL